MSGEARSGLAVDPAPDLVIEIDIAHPSLDKLPLHAAAGVPGVWRYADNGVTISHLADGASRRQEASLVLPGLTSQILSQFMQDSTSMKQTAWGRRVRTWAR